MITDRILIEIIYFCLSLDKKAASAYKYLAQVLKKADLRKFWKERAEEELQHIDYWEKLLNFAEKNQLPHVFDQPYAVKEELRLIDSKVDLLLLRLRHFPTIGNAFLSTYRLEFYMVYPAFRILFHLMKNFGREKTPEDDYEHHIEKFIEGLARYGKRTPELELIGDATKRFWQDSKELFIKNTTDSLTGMLNRRGFLNSVRPLANLAQRNKFNVGIMIINIDNFKHINDSFGHQTGDEVLKCVASLLKKRLRNSDIIARYGSKEFVVYLPSVKREFLYSLADHLRNRVESQKTQNIPVTVSIGISQGQLEKTKNIDKKLQLLIKKADDCLCRAKNAGRNTVVMSN